MIPVKDNIPADRAPVVTLALILANGVAFVLACGPGGSLISGPRADELARVGATPHALTHGQSLATAFSAMFVQASIVALAVNMLFLWLFGRSVEDSMGPLRFVAFYLAGGLVALGVQVALSPNSTEPIVGAAGAIATAIGGYVVLYPRGRILTLVLIPFLFGVIEVPVAVMVAVWVAVQAAFAAAGLIGPTGPSAYVNYAGGLVLGVATIGLLATRRKPAPPTAAAYR